MKQFFKFLFASMLGFLVGIFLLILIGAGILSTLINSGSNHEVSLKEHSILELNLDYMIPERSYNSLSNVFELLNDNGSSQPGLKEILKAIHSAEKSDKIDGIYLPLSFSPNSYATLEEIRNALIDFKKSGKFILSYGEMAEEHAYYMASVSDSIYLNPAGELLFNGFSYSTVYVKEMLNKLGVETQLIRHGKFKAAGEPFVADRMSDENREQIRQFMGGIYNHFIQQIAKARKKSIQEVQDISNQLKIRSVQDALQLGMIDGIRYTDEVMLELGQRSHKKDKKDPILVSVNDVNDAISTTSYSVKNKIAVIYASGDIVSGKGDDETVGSETICKALAKARKDSSIKAVVLRINSPGGSALASDVIHREVMLTRKQKPVIASMGAVAASGGYYIAAPATRIFVEPNAITGSIGVFGMTLNAEKLLREKLGLRFEKVNFGEFADMGSVDRALTPQETAIIQQMIDRIYMDFITKVATGRNMRIETVDSLAQGRVWSGTDALHLKLADEAGGIEDAIAFAAKLAGLGKEYRIISLPEQKEPLQEMLKNISKRAELYYIKSYLGIDYPHVVRAKEMLKYQGIQARMMWNTEIH
ncbi:MAG: signal peptide peptidase SppA [Bacteroidia bacterium]|jgi:protease-4